MNTASKYKNLTASATLKTGTGILVGMYVNSTTSGAVKLWDNTAASGTAITGSITPAVGYHALGNCAFTSGLYAQVVSGTIDVTFFYR